MRKGKLPRSSLSRRVVAKLVIYFGSFTEPLTSFLEIFIKTFTVLEMDGIFYKLIDVYALRA